MEANDSSGSGHVHEGVLANMDNPAPTAAPDSGSDSTGSSERDLRDAAPQTQKPGGGDDSKKPPTTTSEGLRELGLVEPKPITAVAIPQLRDLWDKWMRLKGNISPSTRKQYSMHGRRFCEFMEGKKLSPQTLEQWMEHTLTMGIGARWINFTNAAVRNFLTFLWRYRYLEFPLSDCLGRVIEPAPPEIQIFTHEEYEKIKAYAKGREWCQVHLWLCVLGYHTGMSLVDCCYLRWKDITLSDSGPSFIKVVRRKTRRFGVKCVIPIVPYSDVHRWLLFLKDNMERYKRFDGIDDFVHQDAPGLYECTFQNLRGDFKNLFLRAKITPGKTFKHFRSTFVSNLINSGTQATMICQMTGHMNVKMLLKYLRPDQRALQDGLAKAFQFAIDSSPSLPPPSVAIADSEFDESEEEEEQESQD